MTYGTTQPTFAVASNKNGLTIFHSERGSYTINSSHPDWTKISDFVKAGEYQAAVEAIDKTQVARRFFSDSEQITIDPVTGIGTMKDGVPLPAAVLSKIQEMVEYGAPPAPLEAFLGKLRLNPSRHAWEETILFAEANNFQIFDDGDILGYKAVSHDFKDLRTSHFDNRPGQTVSMPRNEVDDDRRQSCSDGLHVASHEYATMFGGGHGLIVVVKVHPRDIVSIPYDYDNQKMRCCRYQVLGSLVPKEEPLRGNAGVFRVADIAF